MTITNYKRHDDGSITGKCSQCGAPYLSHEMCNMLAPKANQCSYCGSQFYSDDVVARAASLAMGTVGVETWLFGVPA